MSNDRQQRAARAEQMRKEREKADRKQRNLITVGIVVVVVALIAVGGWAVKKEADKNETNKELITPPGVTKDYGVEYTTEVATGKPASNPVKVVAYEDFQCPACRSFEEQSGAFLEDAVAKGDITVEYRPISFLDRASNGNKYSSRSASAAMCVMEESGPKKFKEMHAALFASQPEEGTDGMPDSGLIDMAKQVGVTGIDTCIKTERFVPWIVDATEASRAADVSATPTIQVDGKTVETPTPENLQAAITAAAKG
ncbi:thioredoxin domain-containing protein [Aeromicrobium sp. NPDC092404]|uniref:DsbA family protein n=1 Tax=Aeromicrobium sp. NPDC092404 TaxID=3154976 RepID=UPI00343D5270